MTVNEYVNYLQQHPMEFISYIPISDEHEWCASENLWNPETQRIHGMNLDEGESPLTADGTSPTDYIKDFTDHMAVTWLVVDTEKHPFIPPQDGRPVLMTPEEYADYLQQHPGQKIPSQYVDGGNGIHEKQECYYDPKTKRIYGSGYINIEDPDEEDLEDPENGICVKGFISVSKEEDVWAYEGLRIVTLF